MPKIGVEKVVVSRHMYILDVVGVIVFVVCAQDLAQSLLGKFEVFLLIIGA